MLDGSISSGSVDSVDSVVDGATSGASSRGALHARFLRRKRQQSAWDAEEARDLRAAEKVQLWNHYACVTLIEYLEVFGGIEPRTAIDRVRVSHALGDLPLLE